MNFGRFYVIWLHQLQFLLHELAAAPKPTSSPSSSSSTSSPSSSSSSNASTPAQQYQHLLSQLVHRVITHYEDYYRVKHHAAKSNVFSMFAAPWLTSLERSLHWVAGWRPTTIFHLVYTESSARFEARLMDFLQGLRTGDLGDLSPSQLGRVSELQCQTVSEENEITVQLGLWQESPCDLVSCCSNNDPEIERLVKILKSADDLRLRTMRRVVEILTPQQAVEFLIAAAELQFGVRGWGLDKDQDRQSG